MRGWNSGTRNRHRLWSPHIAPLANAAPGAARIVATRMDGVTKRRTMASITTDRRVKNVFAISYCDKYSRQTKRGASRAVLTHVKTCDV